MLVQMLYRIHCVHQEEVTLLLVVKETLQRELELLTHMDIAVCQVTAWTI